jgi:hypothetical protein
MAEGRLNTGGLDDGLAAIAVEAAHPDSAKRFASAAELAAALDAWLEGSRAREVARLQRWARPRRRGLAAAGAAVLVFAGVAAVLSTRGPSTSTAATSPATAPVPVTVTVPATVTEPVSASRTAPVAPAPAPPPAPPAIAIAQPVAPKSTRRKASNEPGPPPPPAPPAVAAAPPVGPRSTPLEGSSDPGPPRAVDTRPGKIVIQVFPWADIWVDGVHRGVKDVTVELPPGTHTISLRHPTLGQRSEEIRVEPGQRVERRFNMQALR